MSARLWFAVFQDRRDKKLHVLTRNAGESVATWRTKAAAMKSTKEHWARRDLHYVCIKP